MAVVAERSRGRARGRALRGLLAIATVGMGGAIAHADEPPRPIGSALVYDRGGRLSAGVGLGVTPVPNNAVPPIGVFGRVRLLRAGRFALGFAGTLSRTHDRTERLYDRPPAGAYATDDLVWTWEPGYRATGALAGELAGTRWSLRVEGGLGMLLNDPKCSYGNGTVFYDGNCNSAMIPEPYHFGLQPGRVIPSVTAAVGYRFGVTIPASEVMAYRSPSTAALLSVSATLAPVVIGMALWSSGREGPGIITIGAGLALGPSAGHVYAGEPLHAAGMIVLRSTAAVLGPVLLLVSSIRSSDCQGSQCDTDKPGIALAVGLLIALPVLAVYDLIDAPRAAARANARHGASNVGLVPTVSVGGPAPNHGLALAGRF